MPAVTSSGRTFWAAFSSWIWALKAKRVQQLGDLVLATGAEALSIEQLAGALISAVEAKPDAKEDQAILYDVQCRGSQSYMSLARELIEGEA